MSDESSISGCPKNTRFDPLSPRERSERMSRVRSSGNKSTEGAVSAKLAQAGVTGWELHPRRIPGKPDFYFPDHRLVVFVDGCFWHACPVCKRRSPATRADFWKAKIEENRRRDNRLRQRLRRVGMHVMRVWEHEIRRDAWLKRLRIMLQRTAAASENNASTAEPATSKA